MVYLPPGRSAFEFVVVTALRTKQLMKGCVPRVEPLAKLTSTAATEVLAGKVVGHLVAMAVAGQAAAPAA